MALADNVIHAWHFDESSGDAADAVGSMTLTNVNTSTYGAGLLANAVTTVRASSQRLTSTAGVFPSTPSAYTINVWFQVSATPSSGQSYKIFKNDGNALNAHIEAFYFNNSGTTELYCRMSDNTNTTFTILTNQSLSLNTWYMLTLKWNGTTFQAYLNASSLGTQSVGSIGYKDNISELFSIAGFSPDGNEYRSGKTDETVRSASIFRTRFWYDLL